MVCELWCLNILTRSFLFNQSNYLNYINKNSNLFILAYATQEVGKHVSCFPLAYFSCFSCFFRALQKNRALWRLLYLFIMIPNFLTNYKKNHELKLWSFTMLSCLQAWGLKTRQQCKRTVFFSVWWRKLQSFTASRKHGTVSKFPFYLRLVHLLSFFEGRSVEKGGHMISIFFLEGKVTNPAIWLAL